MSKKPTAPPTPKTLADVLNTAAYHATSLMVSRPGRTFRSGLCSGDDDVVMVEVVIEPSRGCGKLEKRPNACCHETCGEDHCVWDQCTVNGRGVGNRCGAVTELMRLYAPVIAKVAAAEAARAAADSPEREFLAIAMSA